MFLENKKIILGSGSPRRKELLGSLDVSFTVDTSNSFEEVLPEGLEDREIPLFMARGKSAGFHRDLVKDEILITADTMVLHNSLLMGKPHSREEAYAMLRDLSGATHEVITAVVIRDLEKEVCFSDTTYVTFEELSDEEIYYYIDKYKPFDKAGAYGIQEWIGYCGISSIKGSVYNVVGLPVHKLWQKLKDFA